MAGSLTFPYGDRKWKDAYNEKFFQVFDFDEGRPFEPDFIMILKKRNKVISVYQIFIEPKGGWTYDMNKRFELSQEAWKQKFLLEIENKADADLKFENKYFKLKTLEKEFEEALENKILKRFEFFPTDTAIF